jgi:predicted nucleotidyltransferase
MDKSRTAKLKKLFSAIKGDRRIVAAVLFGSWARGEQKPLSDLDVCIIPAADADFEEIVRITPAVDADISYFYSLPLQARERVLAEGKPFIINDRDAFAEIKTRTVLAWLDFKPVRERLMNAMLAKGVF